MTDLRPSVELQQKQQRFYQKPNIHETYKSSPEPAKPIKAANVSAGNCHRNPLLHTIADHPNMSSASGGSSTSTTATANTIGRANANAPPSYANENGNLNSSMGEIEFDDREIYYVSPSKRKTSLSASQTPVLRSSLRSSERGLRSFSPTSMAAIAPSYPPIMPSAAYGARLSGIPGQDLSFDNYDNSSHFSDTAMQVLRSGSYTAMSASLNSNNQSLDKNCATIASSKIQNGCTNSSSSSSLQQHLPLSQQRSQNNVTFSNHVNERGAECATTPQHNRGSLRRSKGRSNQSLCSCDAGDDAELNPDPTRPLYEYSLERRHKRHTYTCEQNAQILMRLEKERQRKLSLTGSVVGVANVTDNKYDIEVSVRQNRIIFTSYFNFVFNNFLWCADLQSISAES